MMTMPLNPMLASLENYALAESLVVGLRGRPARLGSNVNPNEVAAAFTAEPMDDRPPARAFSAIFRNDHPSTCLCTSQTKCCGSRLRGSFRPRSHKSASRSSKYRSITAWDSFFAAIKSGPTS
jgi:hypothetical protein